MRESIGTFGCLIAALGLGCIAPPPVPGYLEATRDRPSIEFADVPPPPALRQPEPPAPVRVVGRIPGCPALRVFTSIEDVCEHGLLPMHPFGACQRLRRTRDEDDFGFMSADSNRILALGGTAELIVHSRSMYGGLRSIEMAFLALRGANGIVLLGEVAGFASHMEWPPDLEHVRGDATSVEIRALHIPWTEEGEDGVEYRETLRCSLGKDGGIRCNDKCPRLA